MKLKEIQQALVGMDAVNFQLPDKSFVPAHFHVTEVGKVTKKFIDCGGVVREENVVISNCGRQMILTTVYLQVN
jgi:hypothetical protein